MAGHADIQDDVALITRLEVPVEEIDQPEVPHAIIDTNPKTGILWYNLPYDVED